MDDPQLVGHVLMMGALAWFLAREARGRSAVPPVLAMAVAGFYKHNIVAVPVTALLWLPAARLAARGGAARLLGAGAPRSGWCSALPSMATCSSPIC